MIDAPSCCSSFFSLAASHPPAPSSCKMAGVPFRGTSADQDFRFSKNKKKMLGMLKYDSVLSKKVNTTNINMDLMKKWSAERLTQVLGFEDEVVVGLLHNLLDVKFPDPKEIQLTLTGFLAKQASPFMGELWTLLVSAQENPAGIPTEFLERKKEELLKARVRSLPA